MALAVDISIILIIALIVWRSAVHGFVRTVIEVVGYILSAVVALSLSSAIADAAYDNIIRPKVISAVRSASEETSVSAENFAENVWDNLPSFISGTVGFFGSKEDAIGGIGSCIQNGSNSAAQNIADKAVKPIATNLVRSIGSTVIFILLIIAVKFLAKAINRIFSIPVIGSINATLGGVIGVAKGVVLIFVLIFVIRIAVNAMSGEFWIFNDKLINETYLFRFVYDLAAVG